MYKNRYLIGVVCSILVVIILALLYMRFVSNVIYDESSSHLKEIYEQINNDFKDLSEHNWKMLQDWEFYIENINENKQEIIEKNIIQKKKKWHFTDFYFFNQDGKYITTDGKEGDIDLSYRLEELMIQKKKIVVDVTHRNDEELAIFAIPVDKGKYKGFEYSAIAISYNNMDLEAILNVKAFSNKAECYIVYPDGKVIINTNKSKNTSYNILSYLKDNKALSKMEFTKMKKEIKQGKEGTIKYKVDGVKYYMTYIPVGFQDWVLVGNVPQDIVNESMNTMQVATAIIVTMIVLLVFTWAFLYYGCSNKTKLRKMDVELKYKEELFELISKNSLDLYAMFSTKDYIVEYVSPNVEKILGIPTSEMIGKNIDVLRPSHTEYIPVTWKRLNSLKAGECIKSELSRRNIITGEEHWFKESVYRGSIEGTDKFLLVMMDCTEDKNLRYNLEEALDIAKAANQAKSNFLSNMSHDIRTPMNAIMGFSQLLKKEIFNPQKVKEYIEKISNASEHLLGLINDVLDMSRIESGKTTLINKNFKIKTLVKEIKELVQPLIQAKKHTLNISLSNVNNQLYYGDSTKIKRILINLLSNAIKYTPPHGTINVNISLLEIRNTGNSLIRFEVQDNGIGISEEYLRNIFDPFTREVNTKLNKEQGSGLGLAITKRLVELMGGTIKVASEKGTGTRISVELQFPCVVEENIKDTFAESTLDNQEDDIKEKLSDILKEQGFIVNKSMDASFQVEKTRRTYNFDNGMDGINFLIAEDNEINAEIIKALLDMEGAVYDVVPNGQEAVDKFESSEKGFYDVILMDEQMPIMCGTNATKVIRKGNHPCAKDIKIIAMTANAFSEDVEKSLAAGMNAHISKPVEIKNLKRCLAQVLC